MPNLRVVVSGGVLAAVLLGHLYVRWTQDSASTAKHAQPERAQASHPQRLPVTQPEAGSAVRADAPYPRRALATVMGSTPSNAPESLEEFDEDVAEDEQMAMYDHDRTPIQRAWRATFAQEETDHTWTTRMQLEIQEVGKVNRLEGAVKVEELSCRETICRMYLQFADQLDAKAFIEAKRDPKLSYEFQSLDPSFDGAGFDKSEHTYEALVQRTRPANLPPRDPSRAPTYIVRANESPVHRAPSAPIAN